MARRDAAEYFDQFMNLGYGVYRLEGDQVGARMQRADIDAIAGITLPFNIVCLPERARDHVAALEGVPGISASKEQDNDAT